MYRMLVWRHAPFRSDRQDRAQNVGVAGTKISLSISYGTYNSHAVGPIVIAFAGASRRPAVRLAAAASLARRARPPPAAAEAPPLAAGLAAPQTAGATARSRADHEERAGDM